MKSIAEQFVVCNTMDDIGAVEVPAIISADSADIDGRGHRLRIRMGLTEHTTAQDLIRNTMEAVAYIGHELSVPVHGNGRGVHLLCLDLDARGRGSSFAVPTDSSTPLLRMRGVAQAAREARANRAVLHFCITLHPTIKSGRRISPVWENSVPHNQNASQLASPQGDMAQDFSSSSSSPYHHEASTEHEGMTIWEDEVSAANPSLEDLRREVTSLQSHVASRKGALRYREELQRTVTELHTRYEGATERHALVSASSHRRMLDRLPISTDLYEDVQLAVGPSSSSISRELIHRYQAEFDRLRMLTATLRVAAHHTHTAPSTASSTSSYCINTT